MWSYPVDCCQHSTILQTDGLEAKIVQLIVDPALFCSLDKACLEAFLLQGTGELVAALAYP